MPKDNESKDRNGKWQHLVEKCLEAYCEIDKSSYRQRKIDQIKESHRIYEMIELPASFPWKDAYNTVLPLLSITVDNLEPRIHSSLTGREPYVQFNTQSVTEPDEFTKYNECWFNDELRDVVKINNEASRITHNLLLEGTVYPIATYKEDVITRTDFEFDPETNQIMVGEDGEPVTKEIQDKAFEGGRIEYADFTDIYVPDDVDRWEETDIIRKVRPTYADLQTWKKSQNGYMNIGPWLLGEEDERKDEGSPLQEISDVQFKGHKVIECLEYHVNYVYKGENQDDEDINDWSSERYIALIALESETIIRLIKLRDLNFQNEHVIKRIRLFPERGRAYGNSLYDKMCSIQNGASDTFNTMMNTAYITLLPWFLYSKRTGLPENMQLKPACGVQVDDPKTVVFPRFNINPQVFIGFFDIWIQLWERLGSIGDLQIGKPSQKAETATETMQVIQEGNIKHNYQSSVFKEEFLDLLRTIYDLYYKNMPLNKTTIYRGQEVSISRPAMRRPVLFRLTGSTDLSNKVLELRKAEQLYMMLRQDPLANGLELIHDVIGAFKPDSSPEKYVNPEIMQVINQYIQQKAQEAEMQSQQQQGQAMVGAAQNVTGGPQQ